MKGLITLAVGVMMIIANSVSAAEPAKALSKKEVRALLQKATNSSDHLRLSQHFQAQAEKLETEAQEHAELAKLYRAKPTASESKRPMAPDTARHCEYFAESLAKAAKEARAMASAHEAMAKK